MDSPGFRLLLSQVLKAACDKHGGGIALSVLDGLCQAHAVHLEHAGHGLFVRMHGTRRLPCLSVGAETSSSGDGDARATAESPVTCTSNMVTRKDDDCEFLAAGQPVAGKQNVKAAEVGLASTAAMNKGTSGGRQTGLDLSERLGEPEADPCGAAYGLAANGEHKETKWKKVKKKRDEIEAYEVHTGVVVKFFRDRGFGYISPDGGGMDLFVHHGAIVGTGFRQLLTGQKVRYRRTSDSKQRGSWKAVQVEDVSGVVVEEN